MRFCYIPDVSQYEVFVANPGKSAGVIFRFVFFLIKA